MTNAATSGAITIDNVSIKEIPGHHATQATAAKRPTHQSDGTLHWIFNDQVDDTLLATVPDLGTNATVAFATDAGTTILPGQTIAAGAFETLRGVRTYAVLAIDRPLTAVETANVASLLDAKRGAA